MSEFLNKDIPVATLLKWQLAETERQRKRAEAVAEYARALEIRVEEMAATIDQLEETIASGATKAAKKRQKKLAAHLKKYLGALKTEASYIEDTICFLEDIINP